MMHKNSRGRFASLMAGLVATSMLTLTAGSAGAVEAGSSGSATTAVASSSVTAKPVKSNEFGTMRSVVKGKFGKNGVVTGTFTPRRFVMEDGTLMAKGLLRATLTRGSGKVVGTKNKVVTIDVKSINGVFQGRTASRAPACDILRLVLGPLDLNLLGLRVQLNRVVLTIDAEPGPGNLLGNLLCAVAGLLDNRGVLTQVRQILNSILAILRL
jgi:hypothetical protein